LILQSLSETVNRKPLLISVWSVGGLIVQ